MSINNKQPKKHHYVPQFLLRNFSINNKGQIYVIDKVKKKHFTANIKEIAHENNFYKDELFGYDNTTEIRLSNLESRCSPLISRIIENGSISDLTDEEVYKLSFFAAVQLVRTKNSRNIISDINSQISELIKGQGLNPDKDVENFKTMTENEAKSASINLLNTSPQELVKDLLNKEVSLVKAPPKEFFYIGDNPIVMHNHLPRKHRGNLGIGLKGIEIHLPISPKFCIIFACSQMISEMREGFKKYKVLLKNSIHAETINRHLEFINKIDKKITRELQPENIEFHNSLQVNQSVRFIFSNKSDFILANDMLKIK